MARNIPPLPKIKWRTLLLELLVVFLGVTAGFILNNWRSEQGRIEMEKEYIEAFSMDVEMNIDDLRIGIERDSMWLADIFPIVKGLSEGTANEDSLEAKVVRLLRLNRPTFRTSTYEAIIHSGGLGVIRDFQLRSSLANYHLEVESMSFLVDYHLSYFQDLIMPQLYSEYDLAQWSMRDRSTLHSTELSNAYVGFYSLVSQQKAAKEKLLELSISLQAQLEESIER